jgi:PST family polysaccharide transporter
MSFVAGKAFSFAAQIVLGILLLDKDFGIFAIATSVATFAKVFHDGGIAQLLIQRGPEKFRELGGPGFWMGLCFSLIAGAILAAAAPLAGLLYNNSELTILLWIIAASIPLAAPAQVQRAKLRMDLGFRALAIISVGSYAIRHLGAIALAYQGFGARSFVLPLLAVALFEDIAMYGATRAKLWREPPNVRLWPGLFNSSAWVIAASFFSGLLLYGDYLVLGLLLNEGVVGQYFFGYQFTTQIATLMAVNLQYVLLPVLSRLANERARQAAALIRTIRVLILVVAPLSLALTVVIGPLEALVWRGKWAAAVPLMQVFAVVAPVRLFTTIMHAVLTSHGKFRIVAALTLVEGLVLMGAAWLAVMLAGPDLTGIALGIGTAQLLFSLTLTAVLTRRWGIRAAEFLQAFVPGWTIALAAAGVTLGLSSRIAEGLHPTAVIAVNLAIFGVLFIAAMRVLYASHFWELIAVTPRPLAGLLRRGLLLTGKPGASPLKH